MNFGFNQNIKYGGEVYHVQTEDGGRDNPVVTTVVFKNGVTVASRRTSYSDILSFEKLDEVVREIMREQHQAVVRDLKAGRAISEAPRAPEEDG